MSRPTDCLMDAGCWVDNASAQPRQSRIQQIAGRFSRTVNLWYERSRQRRELLELINDISLLDDVGLSSYDIRREARKHFWNE